jgi:ABC-type molybdenum transport system ATPase subunit/photorepair protein PhrA
MARQDALELRRLCLGNLSCYSWMNLLVRQTEDVLRSQLTVNSVGLDPPTLVTLSPMLRELAYKSSPRLLLALRPQDPIPDWITHLVILGSNHTIALMGLKDDVLFALHRWADAYDNLGAGRWVSKMARKMTELYGKPLLEVGHILTSTGITRYDTCEKVRSMTQPRYFNGGGVVDPRYLSRTDKEAFQSFRHKQPKLWTLPELLNMTATLPGMLKDKDREEFAHSRDIAEGQMMIDTEQSSQPDTWSVVMPANSAAISSAVSSLSSSSLGQPLIELSGVVVKYASKTVLGHPPPQNGQAEPGLHLTVRENTRLALLGPNGSGKTTLLSLLTSDHPHSYSLPIKFFGRSRLPEAGRLGLSLWDIQSRIGHSSPEIHAFFPKGLSVRRVLESAWAETFAGKPKLSFERDEVVNSVLRWWDPELRQSRRNANSGVSDIAASDDTGNKHLPASVYTKSPMGELMLESYPEFVRTEQSASEGDKALEWAEDTRTHAFGMLPFGTQRLLLLLRAMIKSPDILVLDEAFSGLSPEVREKAMCFLEHGETMFLRQERAGAKHRPSQLVRLPNMRLTVEQALAHCNVSLHVAVGLTSKGKEVQGMTREELLEAADIEAEKRGVSEYRFTGLSEKQALVVVSHVREEVPGIVNEWLRLPGEEEVIEHGRGVEMGRCDDGSIRTVEGWGKVWGF